DALSDHGGVVGERHNLGVPRGSGDHHLVERDRFVAVRIAGLDVGHALEIIVDRCEEPEAATRQGGGGRAGFLLLAHSLLLTLTLMLTAPAARAGIAACVAGSRRPRERRAAREGTCAQAQSRRNSTKSLTP